MGLMRDEELIASIAVQPGTVPYVEGLALPAADVDRYSKDSPIQASSVDLHIGNIYLPGEKETDLGGAQHPRTTYTLTTGETAVITTLETLHLPANISGFGFPPSGVSFKGLLMTNPGHVDPGYSGVMRFTVINMGKEPYCLARGGRIVTLLLFRLENLVHASWAQRNPGGSIPPTHADISRLSRDFVDVEKRAARISRRQGLKWGAIITTGATVLLGILQLWSTGKLFSSADIEDLKKRQDTVEYDVKNRVDVDKKLLDFDARLQEMQREISDLKSGHPQPKPTTPPKAGGSGGN
jgi:deoxycytidine triphosphate deaminase